VSRIYDPCPDPSIQLASSASIGLVGVIASSAGVPALTEAILCCAPAQQVFTYSTTSNSDIIPDVLHKCGRVIEMNVRASNPLSILPGQPAGLPLPLSSAISWFLTHVWPHSLPGSPPRRTWYCPTAANGTWSSRYVSDWSLSVHCVSCSVSKE
jgi:hypothetical protein